MRYGISGLRLGGQRLGVGRYIEYLLKNWNKMLLLSESVNLYVREPFDKDSLQLSEAFKVNLLQPKLTGSLWEQVLLSNRGKELDVLFGPSYTLPLAYRGKSVVATHSVNETIPGTHPWWHKLTYRQIYQLSAQKADMVIVPSESTKIDLQRNYKIPADKIEVVPQGADDDFCPIDDESLLSATRKRLLGVDGPYVLFVGKLSQRRNIPMLLSAFAELKKRRNIPHRLLLFGPNHLNIPLRQLAESLGIADSVVQTDGKVTNHKELAPIYNAADVFVHPSSYEGWSMTTMEALACGTAVVAVNRGGLGELTNGHALMVEEPTVEALAEAIEQVVSDTRLRQELRVKARKRGSAFRWEDTCRQTLDVVRRVAQS